MGERIIVSFHTPDSTYSHESNRLRSSVERLGLPHRIVERRAIGSWARNNHLKPEVIRAAHKRGTVGVLWIDCDSIVWRDPWPIIDELGACDVGAVWHQLRDGRAVFASTVYFAPTARAAAVIEDWIARCHTRAKRAEERPHDHHASDQPYLQQAIEEAARRGECECASMPLTMAFIHDRDRRTHPEIPLESIAIEAFQVSRKVRGQDRPLARTLECDKLSHA